MNLPNSITFQQSQPGSGTVFSAVFEDDPRRDELEGYIASKYHQVHRARLQEFLPILLCASRDVQTLGAAGIRPGQYRPMFLEQYLDTPIEQQIARLAGKPIDRLGLVEIGNLAVTRNGFVPALFVALVVLLVEAGYQWVVFTATSQVERLIEYAGFELEFLAPATPDRLAGDSAIWGRYYENSPRVLAGDLVKAAQSLANTPGLRARAAEYRAPMLQLVSTLADFRRDLRQ